MLKFKKSEITEKDKQLLEYPFPLWETFSLQALY